MPSLYTSINPVNGHDKKRMEALFAAIETGRLEALQLQLNYFISAFNSTRTNFFFSYYKESYEMQITPYIFIKLDGIQNSEVFNQKLHMIFETINIISQRSSTSIIRIIQDNLSILMTNLKQMNHQHEYVNCMNHFNFNYFFTNETPPASIIPDSTQVSGSWTVTDTSHLIAPLSRITPNTRLPQIYVNINLVKDPIQQRIITSLFWAIKQEPIEQLRECLLYFTSEANPTRTALFFSVYTLNPLAPNLPHIFIQLDSIKDSAIFNIKTQLIFETISILLKQTNSIVKSQIQKNINLLMTNIAWFDHPDEYINAMKHYGLNYLIQEGNFLNQVLGQQNRIGYFFPTSHPTNPPEESKLVGNFENSFS